MTGVPAKAGTHLSAPSHADKWAQPSPGRRFNSNRQLTQIDGLVQPQFGDVAGILLELAALDLFDDVDEPLIGARREPDLLALAHDKAVEEFDLGAAAFRHILAHRRALFGRAAGLRADMLLVARQRVAVALAGAGDDFRRQMADLLELVAERLADADRLAAEPRLEAAYRLVLRHLRTR